MGEYEEFNKLRNDTDRWSWVLDNADGNYIIYLDNDDTFVVFNEDDTLVGQFDDYIGWNDGLVTLLEILDMNIQCV